MNSTECFLPNFVYPAIIYPQNKLKGRLNKMKNQTKKAFLTAVSFLVAFVCWTALITIVDVKPIGPNSSAVGFATLNSFVHNITGTHMSLYNITDWAGLVPIAFAFGFAVLGLIQWIKRKHIKHVDSSILILGGYYIVVMFAYFFFESFVINYRPILINGYLEASYPSSTTLLVLCIMPTSIMQLNSRIKSIMLKRILTTVIVTFIIFMVAFRLVSGVHWLSDIVGGVLLSASLVEFYRFACKIVNSNKNI